ncbi:MAG: hypothetical protein J5829_08210 [Lachnospiraceae bacterium]|nr:hypothetical protein [Lachnospiraceae bacterium]
MDFDYICNKLGPENCDKKKKGDKFAGFISVPHDTVIFEKNYSDFEYGSQDFIMHLYYKKNVLNKIKKMNSINLYLCCYICSEMGQIGFFVSSTIMKYLSEIELDLNFDILSFGLAEVD